LIRFSFATRDQPALPFLGKAIFLAIASQRLAAQIVTGNYHLQFGQEDHLEQARLENWHKILSSRHPVRQAFVHELFSR